MRNINNLWGNPQQPQRRGQEWSPPYVQRPGSYNADPYAQNPWSTVSYMPLRTEREEALGRQLAQAQGHIELLERNLQRLELELAESRRRLYQWRINIRNGMITFLSVFILVWATVSVLVQRPVLPWEMPAAIMSLLGH